MPAFLVPVDAGQCLIPLEKAILLIGRQSDCDVALTQSRKISRKHCCIAQVNNKYVVRYKWCLFEWNEDSKGGDHCDWG